MTSLQVDVHINIASSSEAPPSHRPDPPHSPKNDGKQCRAKHPASRPRAAWRESRSVPRPLVLQVQLPGNEAEMLLVLFLGHVRAGEEGIPHGLGMRLGTFITHGLGMRLGTFITHGLGMRIGTF